MERNLDLRFTRKTTSLKDMSERLSFKKECKTTVTRTRNKIQNVINSAYQLMHQGVLQAEYPYEVITEKGRLIQYMDKIKENGEYVLDFESTGLNVFQEMIVGICLYTPNEKPVYVPFNHTDINNVRVEGQMDEETVKKILKPVMTSKSIKAINHNIKYDDKLSRCGWGFGYGWIYWDTQIGGKLLNEVEKNHKLKHLYDKYIKKDTSQKTGFKDLFENIPFNYVPIELAGIYGANDGIKTYLLYEFQKKYINEEHSRKDMRQLAYIMHHIEMPIIPVIVDMELRGIEIREDFAKTLEEKYTIQLQELEAKLDKYVKRYFGAIMGHESLYRLSDNGKINYNSPKQLAPLLYDIFKLPVVSRKDKRGTGTKIREQWLEHKKVDKQKREWVAMLSEFKALGKVLGTYVIKIPKARETSTGMVHTNFNQYGAKTGRFSSSHPIYKINLQNIPSKNKEIRKIFRARDGHVLLGSDFSQIEPRTLASMSGDAEMIEAYKQNKDLYATMGAKVYNVAYEECMEFHPVTGEKQPNGKKMRDSMKSVLLGIMYERGARAIAEQFNRSIEWAEKLSDDFVKAYPKIERLRMIVCHQAEVKGYVNTLLGRKRRLAEMKLDKDDWKYKEAHRQCLNAVIQGTAGDVMKLAMIRVFENVRLRELGFRMLITIHDEILGEVPEENVAEALPIFLECMKSVGEELLGLPMKCDAEVTRIWYGEDISEELGLVS